MQEFENQKFEFGIAEDEEFEMTLNMTGVEDSKHYDREASTVIFTK